VGRISNHHTLATKLDNINTHIQHLLFTEYKWHTLIFYDKLT